MLRGRRYCNKACRKTAEVRRYRFRNLHGVQIEDVLPKDGKWLSKLDASMDDALRAHRLRQQGKLAPNAAQRKRKGRRPLVGVVRQDLTINHMALREQAYNIVIRGRLLIHSYRTKVRTRTAASDVKTHEKERRKLLARSSPGEYLVQRDAWLDAKGRQIHDETSVELI